ncbi:MAG: NAD(P)H-dependent oxidoreductase subunit E, partial [Anaerolineae bacterium]|nr:NAD(P)H-dependent oxidoreductase subunit E [Anaerolineae bacterium]
MQAATATFDLSLLTPLLEKYNGRRREALLPLLHEAQSLYGWLPAAAQEAIGQTLRVPLADIHGVVEFYTMFYSEPTAKRVVRVCEDIACHFAGAEAVQAAIEEQLGLAHGETSADGQVTYERVPCLGMCAQAPCALNGVKPAGQLTVADVPEFLAGTYPEPQALVYGEPRLKLVRSGQVDPGSLADYERHGGYETLRQMLSQ